MSYEITAPLLIEVLGIFSPTATSNYRKKYGLYKCSCGNEFKVQVSAVKNGNTKSCGCLSVALIKTLAKTHGMSSHKLYQTWANMMSRCNNKEHFLYKYYGGRGIHVCLRWLDVSNFIQDMEVCYEEGLSIDRIDNSGDYEPSNCRWTTKSVQQRNTRTICASNKSGYRGVHFESARNKWVSKVCVNSVSKHIGRFETAIDAAVAYDNYIIEHNLEHTINGVAI